MCVSPGWTSQAADVGARGSLALYEQRRVRHRLSRALVTRLADRFVCELGNLFHIYPNIIHAHSTQRHRRHRNVCECIGMRMHTATELTVRYNLFQISNFVLYVERIQLNTAELCALLSNIRKRITIKQLKQTDR